MQRLSGLDAIFLSAETDVVPMHVGALLIVDRTQAPQFGFDSLRDVLHQRLHLIPAFRRRPVFAPLNLIPPFWVEDPGFDLDRHLLRSELPAPGTHAALARRVGQLLESRLPRDRPLWQIHYIEGLATGRIALLWKVHHACFDGVLGAELFARVLDPAPDSPPPAAPARPWKPDRIPSAAQLLAWTAGSTIAAPRRLFAVLRDTAKTLRTLRNADSRKPAGIGPADDLHRSRLPLLAPHSRFNSSITAKRSYAFGSFSMATLKAVKTAFDATLNDVVLAICAQAARDYLLKYGGLPAEPLVAAIPISVRRKDDEAATNQVVIGRVNLATDIADPGERLRAMSARMQHMKRVHKSIPNRLLMDWLEIPIPAVLARVAQLNESLGVLDHLNMPANLVISNIPGPRETLYLAGARLQAIFPASITYHGLGLNITLLSYGDQLNVGLTAHPGTVPDVGFFLSAMRKALAELRRQVSRPAAAEPVELSAPSRHQD